MSDFKIRQIVQCARLGKGDFKIIDLRKDEARIQSVDNAHIVEWIYKAHLSVDFKTRKKNLKNRQVEIDKILNKFKR